ncbi:MAG: ABC-type transport system, involved in lipoprotein release, ATPase component [Candidatus Amesbacteria bacterium GW2011_GWB1_47_19]|nr:MAG: ABC-type transport system, involved in lipoprotein release, ATPase component [Candidatus Amesbacteria bacterium GW2011_GWA1_44_24]KKU31234.1 MAG: ABC-type transport system, involved in lipoprotein release, ATPase component [Candidatus Amesbacteria bacterium GW2011_GWC1_46_24]KKU67112.1 MAG: ABC-type transport system, involved in lipoprotein release, ATPase component [Candidatus Amesbacteria bacterium GW2011_GWB1_47_19]HBC72981.1 macrolide ABC transporter ATP-binding protein [Candidatus A
MRDSLIKVSGLNKIYRTDDLELKVLSDINLHIDAGEFVAIMGPSGSGKSTLMHILGVLDLPTSGTYYLDGQNVGSLSDDELADIRNKKIGFVFQAYNLLPRTSAVENVMLPMDYAGIPDTDQLILAKRVLAMMGLSDRLDHPPNKLSGGQQQRVAIARALVMQPAIILADEPTGNIASVQAEEIMAIFQKLNADGHTIIMITHELNIAEHAKRIIHLFDGRVIEDGNGHQQRRISKKL